MKTVTKSILPLLVILYLCSSCKPKCENNMKISVSGGTLEIIKTADKFVKNIDTCNARYKSVSSLLNTNYYAGKHTSEFINYAVHNAYLDGIGEADEFMKQRFGIIFGMVGSTPDPYNYYAICKPKIERWEIGNNNTQNHVFCFSFVKVVDYQALNLPVADRVFTKLVSKSILIDDIKEIKFKRIERPEEYIGTSENANYTNVNSSKGLVFQITLKSDNKKHECYLINNYDTAGTIVWKETL